MVDGTLLPTEDAKGSGESAFQILSFVVLVCESWRRRELWHLHFSPGLAQARLMRRLGGRCRMSIGLGIDS